MIRRAALAALAILALATVPATADASKRTGAQLRAALKELMSADDAPPSVSVLIQRGKRTTFLRRGLANLDTGARPTRRQHYRIASMSKAFNGAVALKLIARGKLRPRDTIGDILGPTVLPLAQDVTVAQALQHTASLPDYIHQDAFIDELIADPAQYMTPLELLGFVEEVVPEFAPGERYGYSDTDNVVVGLMAEEITEKSYEELLERHVYRPAGLRRTSLPKTVAMPKPYLRGYEISPHDPPEDVSEFINPALAWASGGIVSSVADVNRFFRAYVGGKLFNAKAKRVQRKWVIGSSSPPGPGRNRVGLGLFRYRTHCGTVFGHTGSFPGYRLFAATDRTGRRSVVFTVNAQIVPGMGNQEVSDLIRHAQVDAVCHALR